MEKTYRSIFISDVHLGTRDCKAEALNNFLKHHTCDTLYLVGDIIDAWKIQQNRWKWKQSHTNVVRRIMGHAKRGTRVVYVAGNHDEFLRQFPFLELGNIEIHNEYEFRGTFITHGDLYDGVVKLKWLGMLGSVGYDMAIYIDRKLKSFGFKRSLSKFLKDKVKEAVKFITSFEEQLVYQSKLRYCHTVICGHIHTPEDKMVDGVRYLNCGDWIENMSAICIDKDGNLYLYQR